MTTATKHHGGKRQSAGRPKANTQRTNVFLTPEELAYARQIGGGGPRDLSKGIKIALEAYKKTHAISD